MQFECNLEIGQDVSFRPMQRHCDKYSINCNVGYGTITAVKFTKAKIFYDIVDDYYGFLFDGVDSCYVTPLISSKLEE